MRPTIRPLKHDMTLLTLSAESYRTERISGILAIPLRSSTAAEYAILPPLLTRSCRQYPDISSFNKRLGYLYGATVQGDSVRVGQWQVLLFSINYLRNVYTIGQEDIRNDCMEMLMDMIFDPNLQESAFEQEKRCLLERLQSEINNKRLYARQQCESLLCPDQPYAVNPNGTPETVKALTLSAVTEAWKRLLSTARIHWLYQGDGDTDRLAETIERRFLELPARQAVRMDTDTTFIFKETNRTDVMPVNQAKLVLGFRIAVAEPDTNVTAARLMNTLWGGSPTSLLFRHVREEKGLCYYCMSTYDRMQGVLLVDSGINAADAERTKEEILHQLDAIRQGQFSDEDLEAARRSLIQRFSSVEETTSDREMYYLSQTIHEQYVSPEELANALLTVSREDVCTVARLVHFDTTYLLAPADKGGDN